MKKINTLPITGALVASTSAHNIAIEWLQTSPVHKFLMPLQNCSSSVTPKNTLVPQHVDDFSRINRGACNYVYTSRYQAHKRTTSWQISNDAGFGNPIRRKTTR